ncbi:MAG: restriction endonuclease subunit S [Fervidobacterium sp.]|uniref:restriction endonuclease subunit S n=1 Tax=Fervidobacterium sp. TaxID=1871331 RepID=UPI0030A5AC69
MSDDKEFKECKNMPENWKWVRLGEVIEEVNERKGKTNISTVLTVSNTEGLVDQTEFFGRNLSSKDTSNYKIVNKWCFVYNPARINVGSIALNDSYEYAIVSPMYSVFKTKEFLLPKYLSYWVQLPNFRYMVINNTAGSVRESLNFSRLTTFKLPLPPLPEQRKIAEILETIDNAIEKTDAIIEKYKRIKQGLMQDLLTKGVVSEGEGESERWRLRDENIDKFKDSPLGRIPEEWEIRHISDISLINPRTTVNPRESYPYIEMDATPIMGKQYKYITYRKASEAGVKFKRGDVLIARITPCAENGKALLVPNDIHIGIGSTEFIVFRAKENVDNVYLFYLLISDLVRNVSIGLMEGTSGRQRIPKYVYSDIIKVAIPKSKTEQQCIASILSQIDEVIEKEQAYKEKLERIKKGLMEDLLTGKVRVNHLIEEEEK